MGVFRSGNGNDFALTNVRKGASLPYAVVKMQMKEKSQPTALFKFLLPKIVRIGCCFLVDSRAGNFPIGISGHKDGRKKAFDRRFPSRALRGNPSLKDFTNCK